MAGGFRGFRDGVIVAGGSACCDGDPELVCVDWGRATWANAGHGAPWRAGQGVRTPNLVARVPRRVWVVSGADGIPVAPPL
jgi:hypothetical protein